MLLKFFYFFPRILFSNDFAFSLKQIFLPTKYPTKNTIKKGTISIILKNFVNFQQDFFQQSFFLQLFSQLPFSLQYFQLEFSWVLSPLPTLHFLVWLGRQLRTCLCLFQILSVYSCKLSYLHLGTSVATFVVLHQ